MVGVIKILDSNIIIIGVGLGNIDSLSKKVLKESNDQLFIYLVKHYFSQTFYWR